MKKFDLKQIIIFCFILFLILLTVSVIVIIKERQKDNFYDKIIEINKSIKYFDYEKTETLLNEINLKKLNKKYSLIFLKRSFLLSKKIGNYKILYDHCLDIKRRYKKELEIQAISAFACNMVDKSEDVFLINNDKMKNSKYKNIYELSLLKTGKTDSELDSKFKDIINNSVNIESLNEIILTEDDDRFIMDLALLYLKEKEFKKAKSLLEKTPQNKYQLLKMYSNYSVKQFDVAEDYYYQIQDKLDLKKDVKDFLLGCDILIKNGNYQKAVKIYKDMIREKDVPVIAYRNLYVLDKSQSDYWITKGLLENPQSNTLIIPLVYKAIEDNNKAKVRELLSTLTDDDRGYKKLIAIKAEKAERDTDYVIASYQMMINNYDFSEVIARDYILFLVINQAENEMDSFISSSKLIGKYKEWMDIYKSVILSLKDKNIEAAENIEITIKEFDSLEKCYNYAVVLYFSGRYKPANEFLDKAVLLVNDTTPDEFISKIYYKKAQIYYNQNNMENARNAIIISEDYNKDNLNIRSLYRELIKK